MECVKAVHQEKGLRKALLRETADGATKEAQANGARGRLKQAKRLVIRRAWTALHMFGGKS